MRSRYSGACEGLEQRAVPAGLAAGRNEEKSASGFQQKHFRGVATGASPGWAGILHDDCGWHRIALPCKGTDQRGHREGGGEHGFPHYLPI
ncbi:MAG: hypothetical protein IJ794_02870 [Lachnospiraceae bacterium]|nr:hypothetical protein [Lachnospiraceae bacterium]